MAEKFPQGAAPQENKMGVLPIGRLLTNMAVPMMISMLVQACYNVVDSVFVAQISEDALTAVSLASPLQNLMIAFGAGTAVGINALLSRSLGEKNQAMADRAANTGIFLALCNFALFALIGIFFSRTFFELQAGGEQVIIDYGVDYASICLGCSIGIFSQFCFERLLQSTGRTFLAMCTQLTGALINIVLDPILIFGWFGLPRVEVAGAAIATVAGQIVAAAAALSACGGSASSTTASSAAASSTAASSVAASAAGDLSGNVATGGSTSMKNVIAALTEGFAEVQPGVTVSYDPTGSGAGITGATDKTLDIGLSSRALKSDETGVTGTTVALDGIAIIVNKDSKVEDLTVDQLKQMFTGEITNWSEVGGDDGEIVLVGREAGSGTRDGFESIVDVKDACKYAQELTATGAVISAVEANPLAIGYASLSAVGDTVKAVTVEGVECSEDTVKDGTYKIQRPFVFVTNDSAPLSEQAQAFFDFATSTDAADLIRTAGAVPVNE